MLKCIRHKIVCVGRPQTLSFLRVFANLQKQTISFITSLPVCPSVRRRSAWNNSASTRQIYVKLDISVFSEICKGNSEFRLYPTTAYTLHENVRTFTIVSP